MQKGLIIIITVFYFSINGCAQKDNTEHKHTNALINETSPYLLQHAHNPVNWYPWGTEALEKAKKEGKLLIISIGYSACHWCHVMERESYEDSTVAKLMNDHFVSIKIDREERPDIDQVYIEAAQMMTGSAGWPLNVVALPDATPVFTGTYFPKDQWIKIISKIQEIYEKEPERLHNQSEQIMKNLAKNNADAEGSGVEVTMDDLRKSVKGWKNRMDKKYGGLQSVQKFPLPGSLLQLFNFGYQTGDMEAMDLVELTLDKMALGGIYDHVGGGFHRYTVESTWKIPHFEKMLYDNGQLISLYSAVYQVTGKEIYKNVIDHTLSFIENEMTDKSGGFYSSYDADSEGVEGKFYVWDSDELTELLGKDAEVVMEYFTMTEKGNWEEGKNILYAKNTPGDFFSGKELNRPLQENLEILKDRRDGRIKPGLDDKVLTAWNALMLQGFVDAYRATGNNAYLKTALKNAKFIAEIQMSEEGRLNRNYKDGKSSINGFLDDYAFTIVAFTSLYQVTFDQEWLDKSILLTDYAIAHFYDDGRRLFHYKSDLDEALIVEKYGVNDNVIPSGNSMMARSMFILGNMFYDSKKDYLDIVNNMTKKVSDNLKQSPQYYYGWLPVFLAKNDGFYEIAIVGENYEQLRGEMQREYIPDAMYLGGKDDAGLPLLENKKVEGETFIYVCRDKYCKLPVKDVQSAINLIERE